MAVLGCIADDFTGASDAASFLVKGGMSVRLYNGVPETTDVETDPSNGQEEQAIVIALKSRTQEKEAAIADTLAAAAFLKSRNVKQIYFKYCSTFDSTLKGNIGPVADALMNFTKSPYSILCPALPVNGRIVKNGCLYVNGIPLHESHMKDHPLTPMWDARIAELMKPQSIYPCHELTSEELDVFPANAIPSAPCYEIPDYTTIEDGAKIAAAFWHLPLLTGGSGLLEPLARIWIGQGSGKGLIPESATKGKALLLAGSCSKATLGQIACYQSQGKPSYKLDPKAMLEGSQTVEDAWNYIKENTTESETVLVYSSDSPDKVKEFQSLGMEKVASLLENALAELAARAVQSGYTRIISAGGETSGAVTKKLCYSSYWIGKSVAPGVPIMVPTENRNIRLILKSGNFGQEDFFARALADTEQES
ncbi:MAG: four-carbon acid sugar kinase family protein [Lachnospiraceae bacterium]|nr:four-carbon acid sugar kinase family protein [Lachnospiraceae bacterium]